MRQMAVEHRARSLLHKVEKVSFGTNEEWGVANRRRIISMERCKRATLDPTSLGQATRGICLGNPSPTSWRRLPARYSFATRLCHV
jgi:hypothetical protein